MNDVPHRPATISAATISAATTPAATIPAPPSVLARRAVAALLSIVVLLAGCGSNAAEVGETTEPTNEPTAQPAVAEAEPTAVSAQTPSGDESGDVAGSTDQAAAPTPTTAEPTAIPADPDSAAVVELAPERFRADNIQGISHDGVFAYAGTTSPWNEPTRCTAAARESLAVIDMRTAVQGDIVPFAGGLEQTGDVRRLVLGPGRSVAVLSSCGTYEDGTVWLQAGEIDAGGRFRATADRIEFDDAESSDPFLLRWTDATTVELRVIIETDPDDYESWLVERRQVDVRTGEIVATEQFGYLEDDEYFARETLETDAGVYRVIDDPAGGVGCEGFGVARTIELDTGSEQRVALTQPDLVFSGVNDLHISPGGYVAWTSGCEGFVTAYVGKVLDDGSIADAHFIDTYGILGDDDYTEFRSYRLSDDDRLVAIGVSYGPDSDEGTLAVLDYDLSHDPNFVNTAEPKPAIDPNPLFDAIGGGGTWHIGDTLARDPVCGASTLYGRTDGGFVRAFPTGTEIDGIVAVDLTETIEFDYGNGETFASRTVVLQTECPGQYEGRRVWFGLETPGVLYGFTVSRADLVDVRDVVGVRDELSEDGFVDATYIEVELLDGTTTEVELEAVPFD